MSGAKRGEHEQLEEHLGAILRGAAKLLGCNSTSLVLINDKTRSVRVRVGTMATGLPTVAEVEQIVGGCFDDFEVSLEGAQDSMVYRSWAEGSIRETSSLPELVGAAFPRLVTEQIAQVIGEHRFITVPARSGARSFGVLLFEKEGCHPFSRQQREVLLRYARRIGEILETDLTGRRQSLLSQSSLRRVDELVFDLSGAEVGCSHGAGPLVAATREQIAAAVRGYVAEQRLGDAAPADSEGEWMPATVSCGELRLTLTPLRLDGALRVLCLLRRQAAAVQRSLESQLLQLTLGDPVPAVFVDTDFRVTSCNQPGAQLFGCGAAELRQTPLVSLLCEPDEVLSVLSRQVVNPERPYGEEPALVRRKDGSVCPARLEALLLADQQARAVGFLLLFRGDDAAAGGDGEALVEQGRMATVNEVAAQIAHELRNPLVAIGATLESLLLEELGVEQREVIAALVEEIVRVDAALRGYLAPQSGLSLGEVSLARIVDDARRLLQGAHKLDGKSIVGAIDPQVVVRGDHDALRQVLFNLLNNALEASPDAGEISCHATVDAHHVTVAVCDRGTGLKAPPVACFRKFFTTKTHGTGLGLAVSQQIARAHGGAVRLRERAGGGCEATLILPRDYRPASLHQEPRRAAERRTGGEAAS